MTGVAGGTAACGGEATKADTSVLTIGLAAGPVSLDPSKASSTFGVVQPLYGASFTHEASDGSIKPWLATSWRYIGSGNTDFELTLRHGVRFSDGQPLNAQAVKTWFEYFAKGTGIFASALGPIESIETPDQWTVRLHLKTPNPILPYVLSENDNWGAIQSPAAVAKPSSLNTGTYGAGPYTLDPSQTVTDQQYTLVPNRYYFDKAAIKYSKIVVKVIGNSTSMVQALRSGQVDVASGDPTTASTVKNAGLNLVGAGVPAVTSGLILAGRDRGPLGDLRVRQALNYAVDRKKISAGLVGGAGTPTSQMLTVDGYDPGYANYYSYDPAKAKSLLASAGHGDGIALNVLELPNGQRSTPLAQAIAADLAKVGVTLKITTASTASQYVADRRTLRYQLLFYSIITWPMFTTYTSALAPTAGINPFGATDPAMAELYAQAGKSDNPAPIWKRMSQRTVTQAYFLPIYNSPQFYFVGEHVGGVAVSPARPQYAWATEWFPR